MLFTCKLQKKDKIINYYDYDDNDNCMVVKYSVREATLWNKCATNFTLKGQFLTKRRTHATFEQ